MFAFAHTLFAPSMALALVILGFQLVMGLRAATLRDVLAVKGKALEIVSACKSRNGADAWRLLLKEYGKRGGR